MHRFRSWTLDPPEYRTQRNRLLPIEGGDGSTLNLDFTTGVLDPRLTFTRSSNATFINSSGLVEWAPANMAGFAGINSTNSFNCYNTGASPNMESASFVAGPAGNLNAAASFTLTANGFVDARFGTSAVTATVSGFSIGLTYSLSYYFKATRSGSPIASVGVRVSPAGSGYEAVTNIVDVAAGNGFTYRTCRFVATTTSYGFVVVYGSFNAGDVFVMSSIQVEPGAVVRSYIPTSGGQHYAPRFDHDPTTLAPRGLLIEGAASNLMSYSEDFSNAAWAKSGINGTMPLTGTAPDNNAASRLLEENTTSYAKHSLERSISISAGIHTFSVWLKEPSTNSRRYAHIQLADGQATAARYTIVADLQTGTIAASGANNGTAGAPTGTGHSITPYPGGWYRVTISMNHVSSPSYPAIMLGDSASLFGGFNQPFYSATTPYKGLLVWGAQLEAGSGSSSYIPTGASQAQRLADSAVMNDIASLNYSATNGSIYWSGIINKQPTSYITLVGFMTAIDQPAYETFGNALNYFTAARGATLNTGGSNEVSRPYVLGSLIKYASSVNTLQDPIVAVNLNGSAGSINKAGTGDLRVATRFVIGRQPSNTYGAEYPSVTIRSIKYWPTSKVAAELAALTA